MPVMWLFRWRWPLLIAFLGGLFWVGVWILDISFTKSPPPPVPRVESLPVEKPYFYFEDDVRSD